MHRRRLGAHAMGGARPHRPHAGDGGGGGGGGGGGTVP